jgi:hypothetical protein
MSISAAIGAATPRHLRIGKGTDNIKRWLMARRPLRSGSGAFCKAQAAMKSIPLGITIVVFGIVAYLMLGAALAGVG